MKPVEAGLVASEVEALLASLRDAGAPEAAAPAPPPAPPPERPALGGPWVTFRGGPFVGDQGPSGGPRWSIDAPGLPAISSDGAKILVPQVEDSLGVSPNLTLLSLKVADASTASSTPLLGASAFLGVQATGANEARLREGYAALEAKTAELVLRANERLTREAWSTLVPCTIDSVPDDPGLPWACAFKEQRVQCGSFTSLLYREPRLDLAVRGTKSVQQKPSWVVQARAVPGNEQGTFAVRGCLGAAYLAPAPGLVVVRLDHACQGGGDGCFIPSRFQIVRLPIAPGPEPKSAP